MATMPIVAGVDGSEDHCAPSNEPRWKHSDTGPRVAPER